MLYQVVYGYLMLAIGSRQLANHQIEKMQYKK